MANDGGRAAVVRSFAGQAAAFEDPTRSFGAADVMAWMAANTPARAGDLVLEVAAGTALYSRSVVDRVAAIVAVDLTPEMLAEGKRAVDAAGVDGIVFQVGDATALPFLDASFDLVLSRLAIHHFDDAGIPLAEMARVCRPGGTVAVIDLVVPEGGDAARFDELERRRDPAHTRALTAAELGAAMAAAGLDVVHRAGRDNVLVGERWLEQTSTPASEAERIRAAWRDELAGGAPTGMRPRWAADGTTIEFVHRWELFVGTRD